MGRLHDAIDFLISYEGPRKFKNSSRISRKAFDMISVLFGLKGHIIEDEEATEAGVCGICGARILIQPTLAEKFANEPVPCKSCLNKFAETGEPLLPY